MALQGTVLGTCDLSFAIVLCRAVLAAVDQGPAVIGFMAGFA